MRVLPALLSAAAFVTAAAPASADFVTIGSDLSARATLIDSDPNDWTAWNTTLESGGQVTSPVKGELNSVSIKGFVLQRYELPVQVNILVLRPQGGGRVAQTVTSQPVPMPTERNPDQITTFTRDQLNLPNTRMCVEPGDSISFFINGGFEVGPDGLQAQVFGRVAGSTTSVFKQGDDKGLGRDVPEGPINPYAGRPQQGRELLLQATIGTGQNARYFCGGTEGVAQGGGGGNGGGGGGPAPTPAVPDKPATLRVAKAKRAVVRRSAFSLKLRCQEATPCAGRLIITRAQKALATKRVSVPAGAGKTVKVKLNKLGRRTLRQKGDSLNVVARIKRDGYETVDRPLRIAKPGVK